jgi:hypothetical protein
MFSRITKNRTTPLHVSQSFGATLINAIESCRDLPLLKAVQDSPPKTIDSFVDFMKARYPGAAYKQKVGFCTNISSRACTPAVIVDKAKKLFKKLVGMAVTREDGTLALPNNGTVLEACMNLNTSPDLMRPHVGLALIACKLHPCGVGVDTDHLINGRLAMNSNSFLRTFGPTPRIRQLTHRMRVKMHKKLGLKFTLTNKGIERFGNEKNWEKERNCPASLAIWSCQVFNLCKAVAGERPRDGTGAFGYSSSKCGAARLAAKEKKNKTTKAKKPTKKSKKR